ncbi:Candidate exodeoxyribonuclease VII, large subunit [Ramlibacter tataouinensis TTB310]|uniref:Exodeoxyribonuclease 7 large subunit n=1 Tax=Ramlibacter tataouinensis (strain ATCC BAA-407 / DSM 14655 / LMG 21543 / TTB310) TaxID=365046 RepID=F5XZS4_RAMTT|nr:Candidate exodeoxyribonuclease VII, large subunit [Ramlibacter tataouinensis TTB310]
MAPRTWQVGALCRAIAESLDARFNPVAVRGEVSGFSRAPSGHCYFTLKDASGQLRCAMFRRAASLLEFLPRDGDVVEVRGRLDVYEPRGDLQLIVESLSRAGQGALFEQFLRLKARLEAEGLFDAGRKRPLPALPRGIGLVTSLGAAALHDVVTALRRRAAHVPVVLAPAAVQGAQAPAELVAALRALYARAATGELDVILLVRGGGSLEDLWAFNDEQLARTVVASPVPLVSGVGHETDFTIADFCADLRAPTPTAAAELAAQPRDAWLGDLARLQQRLRDVVTRRFDVASQRLDAAAGRLGRPSARAASQHQRLERQALRLRHALERRLREAAGAAEEGQDALQRAVQDRLAQAGQELGRAQLRLELMDPRLVLRRGYALLTRMGGEVVSSAAQVRTGEALRARLADGEVDLTVAPPRLI